jgi:hypothetical protein
MIPDKLYPVPDDRVTTNLTLAGFAFTVTASPVPNSLTDVVRPVHLFSVALASFFASYLCLFLRICRFLIQLAMVSQTAVSGA